MRVNRPSGVPSCTGVSRRTFLADCGMGFTGLALGAMLHRDGVARADASAGWAPPDGRPHFAPKAKSVIWLFMVGGVSHLESFDPKPELNKYAGKTIAETPYKAVLDSPYLKKNLRELVAGHAQRSSPTIYPMQVGFRKRGQSGIEVSDWWPHVGDCVDDIAVVRSMWTTDNDHGAQLQFHTGRHVLEGQFPTIGSWVHYGLGSLNDNLPQFVVLGTPHRRLLRRRGRPRRPATSAPSTTASSSPSTPTNPLPFAAPGAGRLPRGAARPSSSCSAGSTGSRPSSTPTTRRSGPGSSRTSWPSACRRPCPRCSSFADEPARRRSRSTASTSDATRPFGRACAWRPGGWSSAASGSSRSSTAATAAPGPGTPTAASRPNHAALCGQVDQPIAGLLKDLKRRGLLDETLVVWATEFGRTPGRRGRRRPRPPPLRLLRLAGRRRHQGGRRPRRDRRARLPRRRGPPLRHRHPRHGPAPARPRPAPARGPRPQAAGDRLRQADPRDHRLIIGLGLSLRAGARRSQLASGSCLGRLVRAEISERLAGLDAR